MSQVETRLVKADEAGLRVDRWFKRHFPGLGHGRLEKLLRTGQVRVDGGRVKSSDRIEAGQSIRIPPMPEEASEPREAPKAAAMPKMSEHEIKDMHDWVLYKDKSVIVINKPAGLATQGGTGQVKHVDGLLGLFKFGSDERPRLVHRLDRDTSGVLVLARTAKAAAELAEQFRSREAEKIYWALTVGVPKPYKGKIDAALAKLPGKAGERMVLDEEEGKRAVTLYSVVDTAGQRAAWVELRPLTGRTHQLRAHCAALGCPIAGDGKYGGNEAMLTGLISRKLHLHARRIRMPHPDGGWLDVTAPLPKHMSDTWRTLGFIEKGA